MIPISDAARNSLNISKTGVALVRLFYGAEGANDYITIASGEIGLEWTEEDYRPLLTNAPVDLSKLDMFTHKFSASEIKLQISNGDYHPNVKFSDLVSDASLGAGNDFGFENRKCEIRIWAPGLTTWAECPILKTGTVRDIAHSFREVVFSIQDRREIIHHSIGTLLTDADAADSILPVESQGKIKPLPYGDHTFQQNNPSKALDTISNTNNATPCVYLGIDSTGRHRWLVADFEVNEIDATSEYGQIWAKDPSSGRLMRLTDFVVEQNTSAGCIISHDIDAGYFDYWYPKGTVVLNENGTQITAFSNEENMIDGDFSTVSSGQIRTAGNIGDYIEAVIPFPAWDVGAADDKITSVRLVWYGLMRNFSGGADTGDYDLTISSQNNDPGPIAAAHPDAQILAHAASLPATQAGVAENTAIRLERATADAAHAVSFDIYEVYKRITYRPTDVLPLYFAGKGREYGSWINGRSTADVNPNTGVNYTSTHVDDDNSGDLIENPIGIIESLYRDELGQVNADFDLNAFNAASILSDPDKFSFAITKPTDSLQLMADLGLESRSYVWLQSDGTIKVKVLEDTYSASDRSIKFRDSQKPQFTRTKPQQLFTAVNLVYSGKQTGVSEDTAMQSKYNITEAQSTLEKETKFIFDDTTSTRLQAFLLAQWKQLHNQFDSPIDRKYIDLDLGDIPEFIDLPDNIKAFGLDITQENTIAGQIIYPFWWIYSIKRTISGVFIKPFQLHDLS